MNNESIRGLNFSNRSLNDSVRAVWRKNVDLMRMQSKEKIQKQREEIKRQKELRKNELEKRKEETKRQKELEKKERESKKLKN